MTNSDVYSKAAFANALVNRGIAEKRQVWIVLDVLDKDEYTEDDFIAAYRILNDRIHMHGFDYEQV